MTNHLSLNRGPVLLVLMAVWPLIPEGEQLDLRTKDPRFPEEFKQWLENAGDAELLLRNIDNERHLYSALLKKRSTHAHEADVCGPGEDPRGL